MRKETEKTEYYAHDTIGKVLSYTRNRAVLRHIQGYHVDIGCGDGQLIKLYSGESTGVDICDYGNTDIVVSNFNLLPFENDGVDTVTIVASFNYFEQPIKVLNEVRRILRHDGRLILTMPNALIMKFWHKIRERWAFRYGYKRVELRNLLHQARLQIVRHHAFMLGLNHIYIIEKK
mgnify:CR=1 FL=1